MRKRKIHTAGNENNERWMVSYADFITLLFAFFVVMYAVSSVNEGKYRVLSDSLSTAFNVDARALDPIQVGKIKRSGDPTSFKLIKKPVVINRKDIPRPQPQPRTGDQKNAGDKAITVLFEGVRTSIAELSDQNLIQVHNNEFGVEIEISTQVLFDSGGTQLSSQSRPVLEKLANVLAPFPHEINVQGYTDNQPIQSNLYPSNWELSTARAASVVKLFMQLGIAAKRLSATGYGEYRPITNNDTDVGRQRNRRVVIFIPVLKDKAKVDRALNRLQDRLNRGVPFTRPSGQDTRGEGFRRNLPEAPARIIDAPSGDTRFSNPSAPATVSGGPGPVTTPKPANSTIANPRSGDGQPAGTRHIGRQPIGSTPVIVPGERQ